MIGQPIQLRLRFNAFSDNHCADLLGQNQDQADDELGFRQSRDEGLINLQAV